MTTPAALSMLDMSAPPVRLSPEERAILLFKLKRRIKEQTRAFQRRRVPMPIACWWCGERGLHLPGCSVRSEWGEP